MIMWPFQYLAVGSDEHLATVLMDQLMKWHDLLHKREICIPHDSREVQVEEQPHFIAVHQF